jgi:hypothetical protein
MAIAGTMVVESLASEGMVSEKVMVVGLHEVESPDPENMMSVRVMVVESLEGMMPVRGMAVGQSESEGMGSSAVHHSMYSSLSLVGARHSSFDNTCVLSFQLRKIA